MSTSSLPDRAAGVRQLTADEAEELGLVRMGERPDIVRYIRDLWGRREFIWLIPRSELRSRSMNTFLGSIWHLLNPLFLAGVYYVIFEMILRTGSRGGIDNYAAFLVIGIMVFMFTQKTLLTGARTVVNDVKLLHNVNFPAAVLPISAGISEILTHLYALAAMLVVVMLTGERPHLGWLLVVPIAGVQLFFNWGLAFFSARITVHFRDTEQFLPYVTRIWLYLSGVLFGVERISDPVKRAIFELNPPYAFIKLTRDLIFGDPIEMRFVGLAIGWAVVMFVTGFLFFWQYEGEYAHAA